MRKSVSMQINLVVYVAALTVFIAITFAFGRYIFSQITPQIVADLNLDYEFVGRINFLNQGFYLLFSVVGGLLSAKVGARNLVSASTMACGLCVFLLSMVTNKWVLLGIVSVQGMFTAVSWIPMVELVARTIPEKNRGLALCVISSGTSYGIILSGLLIPRILAVYDWTMVWRVFGSISLVLGCLGVYIVHSFSARQERTAPELRASQVAARLNWSGSGLLITLLVISGLYLIPYQLYLSPFIESDLGGSEVVSGRCWALMGLIGLFGGVGGGYLADKLSTKKAMVIAYALSLLAVILLVGTRGVFFIYLSCLFFGLVYNPICGFHPTYVSRILPPEQTAKLFGLLNLALGFGAMIGSYAVGYVKDLSGGFNMAYGFMVIQAGLALLICLKLKDDRRAVLSTTATPA